MGEDQKNESAGSFAGKAVGAAGRSFGAVVGFGIGVLAVVAIVFAVATGWLKSCIPGPVIFPEPEPITNEDLVQLVNRSELVCAEMNYSGVYQGKDEAWYRVLDPNYYIKYEAKVAAKVNFKEIAFDVDQDKRVVYPKLPEPVLGDVTVNRENLDYMNRPVDLSETEAADLAKNDACDELGSYGTIYDVARVNARRQVESQIEPLTQKNGYTISWDRSTPSKSPDTSQAESGDAQ